MSITRGRARHESLGLKRVNSCFSNSQLGVGGACLAYQNDFPTKKRIDEVAENVNLSVKPWDVLQAAK